MLVYLNGRFVPKEEATVSVFDHGFLYGDGIYETMRAYSGQVLSPGQTSRSPQAFGGRHLAQAPSTPRKIRDVLHEALTVNDIKDAYVRIQISRGPGEIGLDPALCPEPTTVVVAKYLKGYPRSIMRRASRSPSFIPGATTPLRSTPPSKARTS